MVNKMCFSQETIPEKTAFGFVSMVRGCTALILRKNGIAVRWSMQPEHALQRLGITINTTMCETLFKVVEILSTR